MEISKAKTSLFAGLQTKKQREKSGLFIAEGEKCALDTIGAFALEWLVATPAWIARHQVIPNVPADRILEAPESTMRKISSLACAPEVLAVFRLPDTPKEDPLLDKAGLYLLLDGIQDPGNLGTIIRTADWFGFDSIYASRDTVDVFNPKTVQSTMGSLHRVKVIYTDLPSLIKRSGIENVYGTLLDGKDMFKTELGESGVIVMGNEGKGLSAEMRTLVNRPLLIPPYRAGSHGESLNVAIATAITLARFRNQ